MINVREINHALLECSKKPLKLTLNEKIRAGKMASGQTCSHQSLAKIEPIFKRVRTSPWETLCFSMIKMSLYKMHFTKTRSFKVRKLIATASASSTGYLNKADKETLIGAKKDLKSSQNQTCKNICWKMNWRLLRILISVHSSKYSRKNHLFIMSLQSCMRAKTW